MKSRTSIIAAAIVATFAIGASAAYVADEGVPQNFVTALNADEGVPQNLVALNADEGVPQNLVA